MIVADMGETTRALGRSASNTSPEGRAALNAAVDGRLQSQTDRTIDIVSRSAPGVSAPQTRALLEAAAQKSNAKRYEAAYLAGAKGVWSPELDALANNSPEMISAVKAAAVSLKNKTAARGQVLSDRALSPSGKPTLEYWDQVKRNLDSAWSVANRAGDKEKAMDIDMLRREMVKRLDAAVPEYKAARAGAASYFGQENALDAGAAFLTMKGGKAVEAKAAFNKFSPAEQKLFGEGFATELINKLKESGDRQSVINSIFVKSPAARERIAIALGPQATAELEAHLRVESIMDMTRRALQGNSTTARQLTELGLAGGAGVALSGGNIADPKAWITAAMLYGAKRGMGRIDVNVARRVAEMLASDDPKVVKQAIDSVARNPKMMFALRSGGDYLARALVPTQPKAPMLGGGLQPVNADEDSQKQFGR